MSIAEPMKSERSRLDSLNLDMGDLMPVAILCGISFLLTALWLLVV